MPKRSLPIEEYGQNTISGLINNVLFKAYGVSMGVFCATTDSYGMTNLEKIYGRYSSFDFDYDTSYLDVIDADIKTLKALTQEGLASFVPKYDILKDGTDVVIDTKDIHRKLPVDSASFSRPVAIEPFMSEVLKDLMNDSDYKDEFSLINKKFGLFDRNPGATVWVWVRSLGEGDHLNGKLLNITPFLSSVSISKDRLMGNFSINATFTHHDSVNIKKSSVYESLLNSINESGERVRHQSDIHSLISENDVIFIRLSRLKVESAVEDYNQLILHPSILIDKVFDMVGLVDKASDVFNGGSGMPSVSITGNDLSKLLNEDGSSIYQTRYVSAGKISDELELSSDIFRLWGKHVSLFALQDQTIGKQLSFVIDYMARSKVCQGLFDINPHARNIRLDIGEPNSLITKRVEGIWKIINVGVDTAVAGYTSYNSRLGNDYSNILTQLSQVCQEPFVELYTDTYKDRFHIMARRPPFDKQSVMYWAQSPTTMTIGESDVISDGLDFDQRVYSWYKINIRHLSQAFDVNFRWLFPAKYFQEYADIWGDKPYQVENPYVNHEMAESNEPSAILLGKKMINAGVRDFKYIIESNMYLPFTRTGAITINGNRLFKRGTWVKHSGTGELFYIDSVSHNMSVAESTEWTTTLNVSRGMKLMYLDRYFGVIDLPIPSENFGATKNDDLIQFLEKIMMSWNVNTDNFNFFLKRLQHNKLRNANQ